MVPGVVSGTSEWGRRGYRLKMGYVECVKKGVLFVKKVVVVFWYEPFF